MITNTQEAYFASLPRKIIGAGALFFNEQGQLLIVKPTYRPLWLIPGGTVEINEAPRLACIREVLEEIGLEVTITTLLCIDYSIQEEAGTTREGIHFIFYGGTLQEDEISRIVLPADELSAYQFIDTTSVTDFLTPRMARRFPHCMYALKRNKTVYLENGMKIY